MVYCALAVNGKNKVARAQYTIYPIPHTQTAGKGSKVAFTKNVNIVCDDAIDTYTRQRAQTILAEHGFTATISTTESNTLSNIYLGVASGNGLTKAAATKPTAPNYLPLYT